LKTHQHKDKQGSLFGKAHPIKAQHDKPSTQRAHDRTVEMDKQQPK